ncbi:cysteine desulfurase family protein [Polycladidibacter stylochi]|uniref:cysteine desulfurase family protein n=1 Tax=Polycladidibacter stylochi TaxID=1807766 RepID=UPI00082EB585|nr:cysteine desulfurase family protein [Pseudovibrio stylochi]
MNVEQQHTYLDYNASAPLRPQVREALLDAYQSPGNASSVHFYGRQARGVIESARQQVAALVDGIAANVIFTSGGTEANVMALTPNWLKKGQEYKFDRLFVSAGEHPSVLSGGQFVEERVTQIALTPDGLLDLNDLRSKFSNIGADEKVLVAIHAANSETGVLQPLVEIGVIVEDAGHTLHVDAVQAAGRLDLSQPMIACHSMAISAHKLGGPQGVGALILGHGDFRPAPMMRGGGQEGWRRAGTENIAGIAGFAAAAKLAVNEEERARVFELHSYLEAQLSQMSENIQIIGQEVPRLPNTTCFSIVGMSAETALIAFDLEKIALSSGSACSSGKVGRSHVLSAMQLDAAQINGALRISLGWKSTKADVDHFLQALSKISLRMRKGRERALL